jgi:hypothetical protein
VGNGGDDHIGERRKIESLWGWFWDFSGPPSRICMPGNLDSDTEPARAKLIKLTVKLQAHVMELLPQV